jgi:hypothetical protein
MGVISDLLQDVKLPRMVRLRQHFPNEYIRNIEQAVLEQMERPEIAGQIRKDMRICLTCSSRGISNQSLILRTVARFIISRGAKPFIIPAMGSHGGATAAGQLEVAHGAGITEEYCSCPIISCMDTVKIGTCEDGSKIYDVHIDKYAAEADGIIAIGRIKPHTSFQGQYESGIMKMLSIGLGKQYGASITHDRGFGHMGKMVPMIGQVVLDNTNVICGLALVENAYKKTCIIRSLTKEEIPVIEPELLKQAKALMPRILFDSCDVLIVDWIGKNISGDGMDPYITGRWCTPYKKDGGISVQRVVVLDVTEESHGNISGAGMADLCTRRILDKMEFEVSYSNCITCKEFKYAYLPMIMENDKLAIQCGIKTCVDTDEANPRIIRIRDTLSMEYIEVSEALLEEAQRNPNLTIVSEPYEMAFDSLGNLIKTCN